MGVSFHVFVLWLGLFLAEDGKRVVDLLFLSSDIAHKLWIGMVYISTESTRIVCGMFFFFFLSFSGHVV